MVTIPQARELSTGRPQKAGFLPQRNTQPIPQHPPVKNNLVHNSTTPYYN